MIYTIENDKVCVKINDLGAEIKSIYGKNSNFEYIWHGSPDYWKRSAIVLFPICGRLFEGKYTYNGKEYEMSIHGFANSSVFTVAEHSSEKIVFELRENKETLTMYPFKFLFRVTYSLDGAKLRTSLYAKNTGNDDLPCSLGGHPGFNIPLSDGLKFEEHYIEFIEKGTKIKNVFSDNGFDLGLTEPYPLTDDNKLLLTHDLFSTDAIFLKENSGTVTLKSDKSERFIRVDYNDATHLGFWQTNKPDAPFVCIEPWHGVPAHEGIIDDFSTKNELLHLKNGESYEFHFDITVSE